MRGSAACRGPGAWRCGKVPFARLGELGRRVIDLAVERLPGAGGQNRAVHSDLSQLTSALI